MDAVNDYLKEARQGDGDSAYHGLVELGPQAIPLLAEAYRAEADPLIRALIVEVVRQHRSPTSIDFLADALGDPHPEVWKQALDGLVTLASDEARRVLQAAAGRTAHDDRGRRPWIEEAIEQIDGAIDERRI
jgi:HEAT repeat protein